MPVKTAAPRTVTVFSFTANELAAALNALRDAGIADAVTAEDIVRQSWRAAVRSACDMDNMKQTLSDAARASEARKIDQLVHKLRDALMASIDVSGSADLHIRRLLNVPSGKGELALFALAGISLGARDTAADFSSGRLRSIRLPPQQARREAVAKMRKLVTDAGGVAGGYAPDMSDAVEFGHRGQQLKAREPSPFARFVGIVFGVVEGRPLSTSKLRECLRGERGPKKKRNPH